MRNEFFIERYAHERHHTYLSEAVLDREADAVGAPARQLRRRTMRSRAPSVLSVIANLVAFGRTRTWRTPNATHPDASPCGVSSLPIDLKCMPRVSNNSLPAGASHRHDHRHWTAAAASPTLSFGPPVPRGIHR